MMPVATKPIDLGKGPVADEAHRIAARMGLEKGRPQPKPDIEKESAAIWNAMPVERRVQVTGMTAEQVGEPAKPPEVGIGEALGKVRWGEKAVTVVSPWVGIGISLARTANEKASVQSLQKAQEEGYRPAPEHIALARQRYPEGKMVLPWSHERVFGGHGGGSESYYAHRAAEYLDNQKVVLDLIERQYDRHVRGYTTTASMAEGIVELLPYMAEFAVTGGIASLGRKGGEKAVKWALGKYGKQAAGRLATKIAGTAGSAAARTATIGQLRTLTGIIERTTPVPMGWDKDGNLLTRPGEDWATAGLKSLGETFITYFSEQSGELMVPIVKGAGKQLLRVKGAGPLLKRLGDAIGKAAHGTKWAPALQRGLSKAEFHGLLAEWGEERVEGILRSAVGIDDQPVLDALWPGWRQTGIELAVLGVPTAIGLAGRFGGRGEAPAGGPAEAARPAGPARQALEAEGIVTGPLVADVGVTTGPRVAEVGRGTGEAAIPTEGPQAVQRDVLQPERVTMQPAETPRQRALAEKA
ncbi:MAG TPA: hypothetical protein VM031_02435, partial [Phycisphaerae bacterium]|nr:hypothetical protein [Phycisphaerae bacterium]